MHRAGPAELAHHRAAVVRGEPERVQSSQQAGRVAVPEEGLRVGAQQVGVEQREHRDLVFAADRGDHGLDLRIGEGGVQVRGPFGRARVVDAGGRVLHRDEAELLAQPAQSGLEREREELGQAAGGRDDRDAVTGHGLRRRGE